MPSISTLNTSEMQKYPDFEWDSEVRGSRRNWRVFDRFWRDATVRRNRLSVRRILISKTKDCGRESSLATSTWVSPVSTLACFSRFKNSRYSRM